MYKWYRVLEGRRYIRLETEFVYLPVVIDAFSRRVTGWALDRTVEDDLTPAARPSWASIRVAGSGDSESGPTHLGTDSRKRPVLALERKTPAIVVAAAAQHFGVAGFRQRPVASELFLDGIFG